MKRDSIIWTITFLASIATFLTSQLGGLHAAFPSMTPTTDARIALIAGLLGFLSGYFKMSPLALSPDHPMATIEAGTVLSPVNSGKAIAVLLTCVLAGASMTACVHTAPTTVASIADTATKIEQSANVVLKAAQSANAVIVPSTGKPLVSNAQLDLVAAAVYKIGQLGTVLDSVLADYSAAKAAGKDISAQKAVVLKTIGDIGTALADIGKAIPSGTLQQIDQGIATAFDLIAAIKAGSL
jgi:hypothetical protein